MKRYWQALFDFLASLKLAVFTLITLAIALAAATFVESYYDTETAQHYFYRSPWFAILLGLLGCNVLAAALSRWPWKPRHYGFVVTHAGIITVLIGSLMTINMGTEGSLALDSGQQDNKFTLAATVISVYSPVLNQTYDWLAEYRFHPPTKEAPRKYVVPSGPVITVDDYYQNSILQDVYVTGVITDPPAVHFGLSNERVKVNEWLGGTSAEHRHINFGPAAVGLDSANTEVDLKRLLAPMTAPVNHGNLELFFPNNIHTEIKVAENEDRTVDVPGTDFKVHILQYLPDAAVSKDKSELITRSDKPNNPAVEFEVITAKGAEKHTVLARMPNLPTLHAQTDQKTGVKPEFHFDADATSPELGNRLLIVAGPGGKLYYNIHRRASDSSGEIQVGKSLDTGWMGLQLLVSEFHPHARTDQKVVKKEMPEGKEGPPGAVHVWITNRGDTRDTWMRQGETDDIPVGGETLAVGYHARTTPLGCSLKLVKFTVGRDPGTTNASSYNSDVLLNDPKNGIVDKPYNICMNEPLHYGGYTFFQSSFQEIDGVPRISIFSVARDPGVPVKYAGAILMCSGIGMMFWLRGWYQGLGKKKKPPVQGKAGASEGSGNGNGTRKAGKNGESDAAAAPAASGKKKSAEEVLTGAGRTRRK